MKCSRAGCEAEGVHVINDHGTTYCAMHNRLRVMRTTAKTSGKSVPSTDELLALVPDPLVCPTCDMEMMWDTPDRKAVVSLQHWKDGTFGLICHSCNARMNNAEVLAPPGMHRCSVCNEIKPNEEFRPKGPDYLHSTCRPCHAMKAREYRANRRLAGC